MRRTLRPDLDGSLDGRRRLEAAKFEAKRYLLRLCIRVYFGFDQPPKSSVRLSASAGPQLPGS
jgi:hypothetical protein